MESNWFLIVHVCVCVCLFVHMSVYKVCVSVCVCVFVCKCLYICMCVHVYLCVWATGQWVGWSQRSGRHKIEWGMDKQEVTIVCTSAFGLHYTVYFKPTQ